MTSFSDDFLAALKESSGKLEAHNKSYQAKLEALQDPLYDKLKPLMKERDEAAEASDKFDSGFWGEAMLDDVSPVAPLLNRSTDPRVCRAVTKLRVELTFDPETHAVKKQKISMSLRGNFSISDTDLYRECEVGEGGSVKTLSASGTAWKPGTEKGKLDSLFSMFDTSLVADDRLPPFFSALNELYQRPFDGGEDEIGAEMDDDEDLDAEEDDGEGDA